MNKTFITILILIIAASLIVVFATNDKSSSGIVSVDKLRVVASFYPLYFFTQQIGGDRVDVTNITPSGIEPHDYELTAKDVVSLQNSALVIMNGGGLEPWGNKIKDNINPNRTTIIVAGDGLAERYMTEDGQNVLDPHVWLSPVLAEKIVDKIAAGLENRDSRSAVYYESNAQVLKSRLGELDAEYREGLNNCANKSIVTSHAAFGYLAKTYNLKQLPITGISSESEPSLKQLVSIVKFARDNDVKYIFFESLASPKLSQAIATEIGAQTMKLDPIEGIAESDIVVGKDYFTEMKNNLANLRIALQCQ